MSKLKVDEIYTRLVMLFNMHSKDGQWNEEGGVSDMPRLLDALEKLCCDQAKEIDSLARIVELVEERFGTLSTKHDDYAAKKEIEIGGLVAQKEMLQEIIMKAMGVKQ